MWSLLILLTVTAVNIPTAAEMGAGCVCVVDADVTLERGLVWCILGKSKRKKAPVSSAFRFASVLPASLADVSSALNPNPLVMVTIPSSVYGETGWCHYRGGRGLFTVRCPYLTPMAVPAWRECRQQGVKMWCRYFGRVLGSMALGNTTVWQSLDTSSLPTSAVGSGLIESLRQLKPGWACGSV